MKTSEKFSLGLLAAIVLVFVIQEMITFKNNPELITGSSILALSNLVILTLILFLNAYHKKMFSMNQSNSEYQYSKIKRKKWSLIFVVSLVLYFIYFVIVFIVFNLKYSSDPMDIIFTIPLILLAFVFVYLIIKNILIYRRYGEIDPNNKYTFSGHKKTEKKE